MNIQAPSALIDRCRSVAVAVSSFLSPNEVIGAFISIQQWHLNMAGEECPPSMKTLRTPEEVAAASNVSSMIPKDWVAALMSARLLELVHGVGYRLTALEAVDAEWAERLASRKRKQAWRARQGARTEPAAPMMGGGSNSVPGKVVTQMAKKVVKKKATSAKTTKPKKAPKKAGKSAASA